MELTGRKVLIVGIASSGLAAARLLVSRGATVTANDLKPESQIEPLAEELRSMGVRVVTGSHPAELFTEADLIVVSPGVPAGIPPLKLAREAGVEVTGEVELAGSFLKGRVIGITGSNGKTTTTTLVSELMKAAGEHVLTGGNIGTPIASLIDESADASWTVAELSSFQLETLRSFRVHVAVVTNITPDHLDRHASFEEYVDAKQKIFISQTDSDFAVINGDDPVARAMVDREIAGTGRHVKSKRIFFSSKGPELDGGIRASIYYRDRAIYTTLLSNEEVEVISREEIPLRGMHNVENVMAALGAVFAARGAGTRDLPALRQAIRQFRGVEHRIEFVAEIDGVKYYNDSKATNVDSTAKALEAFDRGVILILGGKHKGSSYRALEELVRERVKKIVVIGAASDIIVSDLSDVSSIERAPSLDAAVLRCREAAAPGDVVLLSPACSSYDMFDNYEQRGRLFKEAVHRLER